MKKIMNALSQYFEKVPGQVCKRKLLIWSFFILATVFFFIGMGRTKFDMTVEGWFEKNDPTIVAFDGFHAEFGSEDHLFIVYKPKDGNVFSAESLKAVKGIRDDLLDKISKLKDGEESALKHIVRIKTLINAPVLQAKNDLLISKHLVGENVPTSFNQLDVIRKTAIAQKKFPLLYFSEDLKYGGILIETDFGAIPLESEPTAIDNAALGDELTVEGMGEGGNTSTEKKIRFKPTDLADYLALMNEIKLVLNKAEYADHLDYYPVGNGAATEYDVQMLQEMGMLYMAAIVIMIVLLWFLFRSLSAVVWPIAIIVLSTIWTIGLTGWLGLTVTAFIMLTVMLILAVGLADTVHILSGYRFLRIKGIDHETAMKTVFKKSGVACLLTSLTTMVGILALNITPIVPVKVFGFMSAVGVGLAFVLTLYLLPLMLDLWSPVKIKESRQKKTKNFISRYIPNFSRFLEKILANVIPSVEKRSRLIVIASLIIFGLCVLGSTKVRVDTDQLSQYPKNSKFRESVSIVDDKMMGAYNMEVFLDLGKENAFQDPFVLNVMEKLQKKIETQYTHLIVRTSSVLDVVKDSYQKLNEGREEMYRIPQDRKVLSQALFLFNNADPEDRRKLVSDNYDKAHISVMLHRAGSAEYTRVFNLIREDLKEATSELKEKYPDMKVGITGMLALMMQGAEYLTWAALGSFGLALLVITIILLLVFGSFRAGLISVIPNLIPATLTLGLLGWFGIPLDFNTMMIAPIIIGIAVDDTIHFIYRYRDEVMIDGNIKRALQQTIVETGQGITFTSLILGLGFGIMSIASAAGTSNVGKFGFLAVFAALLCDLFLLPSLIMLFNFSFQRQRAK